MGSGGKRVINDNLISVFLPSVVKKIFGVCKYGAKTWEYVSVYAWSSGYTAGVYGRCS